MFGYGYGLGRGFYGGYYGGYGCGARYFWWMEVLIWRKIKNSDLKLLYVSS